MMKMKIGKNEYNIFFGYEPTLKARILSKMAKMSVDLENGANDFEKIEDMLLFLPEVVLAGLQKYHSDEFGYDLDTKEGYEEQKAKVFSMVSEHFDSGKVDGTEFFYSLLNELTKSGFLKKMFEKEVKSAEEQAKNVEESKAEGTA